MYLRLDYLSAFGVLLVMLGACSAQTDFHPMSTGVVVALATPPASGSNGNQGSGDSDVTDPQATPSPSPAPAGGLLVVLKSRGDSMFVTGGASVTSAQTQINSNDSSDALNLNGHSTIHGAVSIVGRARIDSGSQITGTLTSEAPVLADPLSSLPSISTSGRTVRATSHKTYSQDVTLSPGVYKGGIEITSGAHVTLADGVYVIKDGELEVNGNAQLDGDKVTILFLGCECTMFRATGGAHVSLGAMASGSFQGISMASDMSAHFDVNGGAVVSFGGSLHVPEADGEITGANSSLSVGEKMVIESLDVNGGAELSVGR